MSEFRPAKRRVEVSALGVERAKVLARALKCHPAVLVFPNWDVADLALVQRDAIPGWG